MADDGFVSGIVNALMGRKAPAAALVDPQQSMPLAERLDTTGAMIPTEDIRNDPMARGMDKNSLASIINSVTDSYDAAVQGYNKDGSPITSDPRMVEALKQIYEPTAAEYNSLLKKDAAEKNKFMDDWMSGLFRQPPNQTMLDAGYMDIPVALPREKYYYSDSKERIPLPKSKPKGLR